MLRKPRLPHFIVVGTQKAGTSSIFNSLRHHPDLLPPSTKETHFFDNDEKYSKGIDTYANYFPSYNRFSGKLTFEITPSYLYYPNVPSRIKKEIPDVKIIAVLRDPVRRAFSGWNMYHGFKDDPDYSDLYDPRSFATAVYDELKQGPKAPFAYLARGYYEEQLSRYFKAFGRSNVLVLKYTDLKSNRSDTLNEICRFVGIAEYQGGEKTLFADSNIRPYAATLDPELRDELSDHFEPHMNELTSLLGKDLKLLSSETKIA